MAPPKQQQQAKHEVPVERVGAALACLTKLMRERAAEAPPNLLTDERDDVLTLQLSLRRVPAKPATKPHLLQIPHPVLPLSSASVCIISDDRSGSRSPAASAILDASKSLGLPVSEVIPFSTLRTDYRPYESRRQFAASHDLFLADRALLPMLPRILGKSFYSTKKAPIAVDFTRVGWPEQVRMIVSSTFLYLRSGTCSGIKVGRLDMKGEEIVENVMAAMESAVEKVPKKWANVRALYLKAVDSVALPLYQAVPELGMKIEVPVGRLEGEVGSGEAIDSAKVETGRKRKNNRKKTLINVASTDGAEVAKETDGAEVAKEESGKRKRNKKELTEDVVMEEVQGVTEKRRRNGVSSIEVPVNEGLKIAKKGKEKKRALDKEDDDVIVEKKKGKKSEPSMEDAGSKKTKGKKEDRKHSLEVEDVGSKKNKGKKGVIKEVDDVGSKKSKGKKGEVKEGKIMKGNSDDGGILKEDMKIKSKKLSDSNMKRRTRANA